MIGPECPADERCRCSVCCRRQCQVCSGTGEVLRTLHVGTGLVEKWTRCLCEWPTAGLSDLDREMLEFEQQWWARAGAKQQAITTTFGLTLTTYYQALNRALKLPDALAEYPALVNRLRRIQLATRRRRFAW